MIDHDSIPFIEETIQAWLGHRSGLEEEETVLDNKSFSTSFTASPSTRRQLAVITAYHRLSSKSKMLSKLISLEHTMVLQALDMARKMEEFYSAPEETDEQNAEG